MSLDEFLSDDHAVSDPDGYVPNGMLDICYDMSKSTFSYRDSDGDHVLSNIIKAKWSLSVTDMFSVVYVESDVGEKIAKFRGGSVGISLVSPYGWIVRSNGLKSRTLVKYKHEIIGFAQYVETNIDGRYEDNKFVGNVETLITVMGYGIQCNPCSNKVQIFSFDDNNDKIKNIQFNYKTVTLKSAPSDVYPEMTFVV